jgi:hypothetical protein
LLVAFPASPQAPSKDVPKVKVVRESGPSESCVDVLFVGDGYVEEDLAEGGKYWKDVQRCTTGLFKIRPISDYADKFNVRALMLASQDRGCDLAPDQEKVHTALECHLDKPDGRFLVFKDAARLKALVEANSPVDIVFVMVNTEIFGGTGFVLDDLKVRGKPCPAPTFSAHSNGSFLSAAHELGHSLAGLADEYADDDSTPNICWPLYNGDLGEPNVSVTRFIDSKSFESRAATAKWRHFMKLPGAEQWPWVHFGGNHQRYGVVRPWATCLMRDSVSPFCPICCEEMAKAIQEVCGIPWDDAAWHETHPLSMWH